jgi:transposase
MEKVTIIGLDLAKNIFQAHGARRDGSVAFRKNISRAKLLFFFTSIPKCVVPMEACASAHHWGRHIGALGHEVRLIAPTYVKPFVKRNKNDAADAEAIAEAASRPTHEVRGNRKRRKASGRDGVQDARSPGSAAHSDDQRHLGAHGGIWRRSA